jgi:ABC-type microcin C transport system permease subunit YejB
LPRHWCSRPSFVIVVQIVPGDPVRYMMGLQADPAAVAAMRHELGLDAPLQRYLAWVGGLMHADFGTSYTYRVPVARIDCRAPASVAAARGLCVGADRGVAFPVGVSRPRRGKATDDAC